METIGNYLKNIRLSRNISIDEVARNTNIPRKYIENIESNNFSDFPGEVYLKGFIKSYASFLGVDPEFAIKLYEKTVLEEKEVPLEVLIPKEEGFLTKFVDWVKSSRVFFFVVFGIVFVELLVWFVVSLFIGRGYKVLVDNQNVIVIYKSFAIGERFRYNSGKGELVLKLLELRNSGNDIVLGVNDKIFSLGLKQEIMLDVDDDGLQDLKVRYENLAGNDAGLRISFFKAKKLQERQDIVLIDSASIPVGITIASSKLVWVGVQIDNTNEMQFYMNKDEVRSFQVKSRLVLKTSDIKALSLFCGTNQVPLKGEGVSYTVIEVSPSVKGVSLRIRDLD